MERYRERYVQYVAVVCLGLKALFVQNLDNKLQDSVCGIIFKATELFQ